MRTLLFGMAGKFIDDTREKDIVSRVEGAGRETYGRHSALLTGTGTGTLRDFTALQVASTSFVTLEDQPRSCVVPSTVICGIVQPLVRV